MNTNLKLSFIDLGRHYVSTARTALEVAARYVGSI